MICTVTFNPSLDYIVRVDDMRLGAINRTTYEQVLPGGKGVNVSIVLGNLGHASRALGFVAGFTGDELSRLCAEAGVDCDFIHVPRGMTRVNVKIKSAEETELNGMGPQMGEKDVEVLLSKLDALGEGDTLVISGSVPACLPHDMYERVMGRVAPRGAYVVVDAERDLLTRALPLRPFLVKPNNHELGDIFGAELRTRDEVVPYARRLQKMGAANVLVSMAGEGGVLVSSCWASCVSCCCVSGRSVSCCGRGQRMTVSAMAAMRPAKAGTGQRFRQRRFFAGLGGSPGTGACR